MVDGTHRRGCHPAALAALAAIVVTGVSPVASQPGRGYRPDSSIRRASGQPTRTILALGDVSTDSYQHESISHALSVIDDLGLRAGLYETQIRTDTQLVTKAAIAAATGTLTFYRNLDDVDAVVLFVSGEPALTPPQKEDLLSFVREGKGLVAIHSSIAAFRSWPEYAGMIGGQAVETPGAPEEWSIAVTEPGVAAMSLFPASFRVRDRILPVKLAEDARVLARSGKTPVAWTKTYGKGRVFVSQLGHTDTVFDRKDVQHMLLEAIRWVMK
jgi:uncharacterized protein